MKRSRRHLLLARWPAASTRRRRELSPIEQRIVAEVKAQSAEALGLLERSVNINSGTMNHAGVRAVGKLFRQEFDQLGFSTRWIDMPPEMQRAGHLLATREGSQGKRLLLLGHLDTVFEPDSPVQKWDRQGERVRGQGVNDMKGGDVARDPGAARAAAGRRARQHQHRGAVHRRRRKCRQSEIGLARATWWPWPRPATTRSPSKARSSGATAAPPAPSAAAPPRASSSTSRASRAIPPASSARAPATARCMKRRASSTASASRWSNRA